MKRIANNIRAFKDESGATLVEYGVGLLVAIIIGAAALSSLGGETADNYGTAEDLFD